MQSHFLIIYQEPGIVLGSLCTSFCSSLNISKEVTNARSHSVDDKQKQKPKT